MESGTSETRLPLNAPRAVAAGGFAPGTLLSDRYRIVAPVGCGGMGEVYRADDLRLGQPVALKFLPPGLEANPFARERLLAEVRCARTVSHPNVCRVYDIGEVHGRAFLTMEFIDGEDLASLLRRIGRLPGDKALEIARQLCAGLAAAHERGVLHRDLKPANVMIDGRGRARITDFGLAVEVAEAGSQADRAAAGTAGEIAGTIAYMAPERFEGGPATVQADLYALGLVLYEIYTGKHALTASTLEGWRRAHLGSTPGHPSALVAGIEPAVERAILRCLEKDAARRPASAAQLAASLPGGDPLAAAIAAGETPSPELVAASGEEGTLPRAQAWLWFGSCLVALALAVVFGSHWQLANHVRLEDPVLQRMTARRLLADLGYRNPPADHTSSYRSHAAYLETLVERHPPRAWFTDAGASRPGPLYFYYRESQVPLFTWNPAGTISGIAPAPLYPEDVYVELDGRGRLATLSAGGLLFRASEPPPSRPTDWGRLFAAAGLTAADFVADGAIEWPPIGTANESRAWVGRVGADALRVEASAYQGRVVQFVVRPVDERPGSRPPRETRARWLLDLFVTATVLLSAATLAALAWHNHRLGRGDRRGAFRLTVVVLAVETVYLIFLRHWTASPIAGLDVFVFLLGPPLFGSLLTWLYYMGVEPFARRRWPHLLIAWTRMLDGRWRDPLVGRSALAGTVVALVGVGVVPGLLALLAQAFQLPLAVPRFHDGSLDYSLAWFLCSDTTAWPAPVHALLLVAVLLVARLALRRDGLAWVALFLTTLGLHAWELVFRQPWFGAAPIGMMLVAGSVAAGLVVVMARHGVLAAAVAYAVGIAFSETPLTYDVTSWYAWRTAVVVVLVAGLAFWGFRNVLGRQPAFPEGTLDQ